MNKYTGIFLWFVMNIIVVILMDVALFYQGTPAMKDATFTKKLLATEFFATLQWLFIIPSERIGNKFLTAPQLGLASFVFDFLLTSNLSWLSVTKIVVTKTELRFQF